MALSLGILLRIFSGGVNTAIVAEDYNVAVQIAESMMAKIGEEVPLKSTESDGVAFDKYAWAVTIEPFEFNPDNTDQTTLKAQLFKITVSVAWGEQQGRERRIELKTLKLGVKPL